MVDYIRHFASIDAALRVLGTCLVGLNHSELVRVILTRSSPLQAFPSTLYQPSPSPSQD